MKLSNVIVLNHLSHRAELSNALSRIRNAHGRLGKRHRAEIHQWQRAELSNALIRLRNALGRLSKSHWTEIHHCHRAELRNALGCLGKGHVGLKFINVI
jgi:hypothetical protein